MLKKVVIFDEILRKISSVEENMHQMNGNEDEYTVEPLRGLI